MSNHAQQMTALASCWTAAQPAVAAFIACSVTDFHDAEDVLQQVAQTVAANFERYDPEQPFTPWAIGIAKMKLLEFFHKRSRDPHVFDPHVFDPRAMESLAQVYPSVEQDLNHMKEALEMCLRKASPRARQVLEMRYVREMKPAQIARQVGTTSNTISVMLHRIRQKLAACIESRLATESAR